VSHLQRAAADKHEHSTATALPPVCTRQSPLAVHPCPHLHPAGKQNISLPAASCISLSKCCAAAPQQGTSNITTCSQLHLCMKEICCGAPPHVRISRLITYQPNSSCKAAAAVLLSAWHKDCSLRLSASTTWTQSAQCDEAGPITRTPQHPVSLAFAEKVKFMWPSLQPTTTWPRKDNMPAPLIAIGDTPPRATFAEKVKPCVHSQTPCSSHPSLLPSHNLARHSR
jgi:hypothetical protein